MTTEQISDFLEARTSELVHDCSAITGKAIQMSQQMPQGAPLSVVQPLQHARANAESCIESLHALVSFIDQLRIEYHP